MASAVANGNGADGASGAQQPYHPYDQVPSSASTPAGGDGPPPPFAATDHSFWALGQYKRSVRRIDDGSAQANHLREMLRERGDIEANYAKSLRAWAKKWGDAVGKGTEYGTTQHGIISLTQCADRRADLHYQVRDRLGDEVIKTLKLWHKDNYHCSMFKHGIKEAKDIEESFRKVQKPWAKLYQNVEKMKREFHAACKSERTAINQEKNGQGDQSVSPEHQKRLADKVAKCREDRDKARLAYTNALADLNAYNGKYMEEMTMVFERCQELERKRMRFFKEMLCGARSCLDLSTEPKLGHIYAECAGVLAMIDADKDVAWWADNLGTGMPMAWPVFEEYTPELRPIVNPNPMRGWKGKSHKGDAVNAGGVILMRQSPNKDATDSLGHERNDDNNAVVHRAHNDGAASTSSPTPDHTLDSTAQSAGGPPADNRVSTATALYADNWDDALDEHEHEHDGGAPSPVPVTSGPVTPQADAEQRRLQGRSSDESGLSAAKSPSRAPVARTPAAVAAAAAKANDDEEEEEEIDLAEPVQVRALYDYAAQEEDELNLAKGELFDKLAEPDDQGWCKGRKGGRIGLYPANYAAPVVAV